MTWGKFSGLRWWYTARRALSDVSAWGACGMPKSNTSVLLVGLDTAEQWQCAHDAVRHAQPGKEIELEYEAPGDRDIVVSVRRKGRQVTVRRVDRE